MHIMCLNGWGGKLHRKLIDYLRTTCPDVLCLQEVVHTASASTDWLEYRDQGIALQQRTRFFSEVCEALPGHNAIFCPAAQGELWEGDKAHVSQWGLAGKQDTPTRLAQADRLREMVQSVVQDGDRLVVCGDFNVLPESETFEVLASLDLIELITTRDHKTTRTSHYKKPGRFADYMFVNHILADARFEVITHPEVSDHCPLSLWIGDR